MELRTEIRIEVFTIKGQYAIPDSVGCQIYVDGEWFKEITGLENTAALMLAIASNQDLLEEITIGEKIDYQKLFGKNTFKKRKNK